MTISGSTLEFDLPKGKVIFHQDLKKYLDIRTLLWQERDEEKGILRKVFEPQAIIDAISLRCIDFIQNKLIASVAQHGLYDLTVEDFLLDNPGYKALVQTAEKHHGYVMALSDGVNKLAEQNRAKAAAAASQQVTGMGFDVISNDPVAHALYAAKSKSVLERQTAQAQMKYNSAVAAINMSARDAIMDGAAHHQKNIFEPEVLSSIDQIFEYILTKYCDYMSQAGQFDKDCLSGIDEARSNAILSNLGVVPDKEAVICKSIQLCPFNLSTYQALDMQEFFLDSPYVEILRYFGLTKNMACYIAQKMDDLFDKIIAEEDPVGQYIKLSERFAEFEPFFKALSCLDKPREEKEKNKVSLEPMFGFHIQIAKAIEDNLPLNQVASYILRDNFSDCRDKMEKLLSVLRLSSIQISAMQNVFNVDYWKCISDIYGVTLSSFDELTSYIRIYRENLKEKLSRELQLIERDLSKLQDNMTNTKKSYIDYALSENKKIQTLKKEYEQLGFFSKRRKAEIEGEIAKIREDISEYELNCGKDLAEEAYGDKLEEFNSIQEKLQMV